MKIIAKPQDIRDILSNGLIVNINGSDEVLKVGTRMYTWNIIHDTDGVIKIKVYSEEIKRFDIHYTNRMFSIIIRLNDGAEVYLSFDDSSVKLFNDAETAFESAKHWMSETFPKFVLDNNQYVKTLKPDGTEQIFATWNKNCNDYDKE